MREWSASVLLMSAERIIPAPQPFPARVSGGPHKGQGQCSTP